MTLGPLICRRVVSPEGRGTNIRLSVQDPVAKAVQAATKRWPSPGEAQALWRSLTAQGWRIEDVHGIDHHCASEGCREIAPFGFGPIGPAPARSLEHVIWTCRAHRHLGAEHMTALEAVTPLTLSQKPRDPVAPEPTHGKPASFERTEINTSAQGSLFG